MTSETYANLLHFAGGLLLLCTVGVVWRHQLGASVRLLAVQGAALAAIPLISGIYHEEAHLLAIAPVVLVLRAAVLPYLISRMVPPTARPPGGWTASAAPATPAAQADAGAPDGPTATRPGPAADVLAGSREPVPLISTSVTLLLSAALTVLAYALCRPIIALDPTADTRTAPAALAVIFIGLLALTTRRQAVSQVVGFLTLDNGIVALAFLLTSGVPLVVELGASLDLLLVVLVVAALTNRMRAAFGGTDIGELQELKE